MATIIKQVSDYVQNNHFQTHCIIPEPKEFCNFETFNGTCDEDRVMLMTSARYGRMSMQRCIERDYVIGCSANVILIADER